MLLSEGQREVINAVIDEYYGRFTKRHRESRKNMRTM